MNFIPEEDLIHRRLYRTRSRNLIIGAWDQDKRGFIGLREKFGSHYPFTEYHRNADPHLGTAQAVTDLDLDVPMDIQMKEYGDLVEIDGRQYREVNKAMLALLEEHEPAVWAVIEAEREADRLETESLRWKPKTEAEARFEEARAATSAWQKEQSAAGRWFQDYIDEYHDRLKADREILEGSD